jgi:UPF0148 protein
MEEEAIKIVSAELLKGAKMLPTHCPKCGYPLFEKDGKVYCPICEKLKNEDTSEEKDTEKSDLDINEILTEKINYLAEKLKDEKEISRIKEIGEALYILVKIKKKMVKK